MSNYIITANVDDVKQLLGWADKKFVMMRTGRKPICVQIMDAEVEKLMEVFEGADLFVQYDPESCDLLFCSIPWIS